MKKSIFIHFKSLERHIFFFPWVFQYFFRGFLDFFGEYCFYCHSFQHSVKEQQIDLKSQTYTWNIRFGTLCPSKRNTNKSFDSKLWFLFNLFLHAGMHFVIIIHFSVRTNHSKDRPFALPFSILIYVFCVSSYLFQMNWLKMWPTFPSYFQIFTRIYKPKFCFPIFVLNIHFSSKNHDVFWINGFKSIPFSITFHFVQLIEYYHV